DNYINDKRKKCIQSHRKEVVFNGGKSKDFIRRYDEGASSSKADFLPQSSKDSNILTTKSIWSSIPSENINNPCSVLANSSDLTYSEHGMENKTTLVAKLNDFWKLNKEKNDSECNRTHVQVTKLPDDRSLELKESSSSMPNIFRRKFYRASELTASHATEKVSLCFKLNIIKLPNSIKFEIRTHEQLTNPPDERSLALKESSSSMPNIFRRKFHRASELTASHATEK
ncbi:Hypothetical protein CINCED_3A001950, partial [Cinara cedri]